MPQGVDYKIMLTLLEFYEKRYVDAKDRTSETNDEESELRLAQIQDNLLGNKPGALMNPFINVAFMSEDDEETRACKTLFQNKMFFYGREVRIQDESGSTSLSMFDRKLVMLRRFPIESRDRQKRIVAYHNQDIHKEFQGQHHCHFLRSCSAHLTTFKGTLLHGRHRIRE
nr:pescadillo homolog [Tanacetum cinerariifolium]